MTQMKSVRWEQEGAAGQSSQSGGNVDLTCSGGRQHVPNA
jgi:hypothetical protein